MYMGSYYSRCVFPSFKQKVDYGYFKMAEFIQQKRSKSSKLLVAAIDFGTAYSGYAYSFKDEWTDVKINKWNGGVELSYKTPSVLLLNPDKTFNSFGYDAEKKYSSLTEDGKTCQKYFYFHRFKMILKKPLEQRVHRKTECKAKNGSSVDAMTIFIHCIRHMKEHLLKELENKLKDKITMNDIDFVLTVPLIWDDTAKMFMREAAVQAGIKTTQLRIALEPEAASIYCRLTHLDSTQKSSSFMTGKGPGFKYMVLDLGGGTADITVHQLNGDETLAEVVPASGDSWGGTSIDKEFHAFLKEIFGDKVIDTFENDPEYIEDYYDFWQRFEKKKRTFEHKKDQEQNKKMESPNTNFAVSIPIAIKEILENLEIEEKRCPQNVKQKKRNIDTVINDAISNSQYKTDLICKEGKLQMTSSIFKQKMFDSTTKSLVKHLTKIYQDIGKDLKVILMVGGFSECSIVQEAVKAEFQGKCRVVIPNQAGLSVVKGAVFFGHQPDLISERVSRYTYGIQTWPPFVEGKHEKTKKVIMEGGPRCKDIFCKIVTKGDRIKPGEKKSNIFQALRPSDKILECGVYISSEENPMYVDDKGCAKLGTLEIPLERSIRKLDIEESLIFGDTELHFCAYECTSKKEYTVTIDLLSEKICFPEN